MELVTMKASIYVTKLLLYTPIHADQVTISMVILVILGSIMMSFGALWFIFAGIVIIHFTVVLDNVNGEIARYRKEGNMIGTFLEELYHQISIPFIFFFLGYGIFAQTGLRSALIFGFLASVFSKSIILSVIKEGVIKKGFDYLGKKPKTMMPIGDKINIKGGSTNIGRKLYKTYDYIRDFWVFPANIIHINIIAAIELVNLYYNFMPSYLLLYFYLSFYAAASVIIQLTSFIVNYKGKTIYHYYKTLFERK